MLEGSPDYTKLVQILGRDALGNLVTIRIDSLGRMIGVMKGQADITWDLHGWWKFIASEATVIKDYSGYGNHLDAHGGGNGAAHYVDGIIGQALYFNGIDAYVGLSDDPSLSFAGAMSAECWMQSQEAVSGHILRMNGDATTYGYYVFQFQDQQVGVILFDHAMLNETTCMAPDPLTLNQWYHVVVTTDRTYVKVYVDGVLKNTVDDLTSDPLGITEFAIGSHKGTSAFFTGDLDEVRVYNRCLSQAEVSWRYNNTNPATGKPTRMVAVDNEGRMMVNVNDLPYKARILSSYDDTAVGLESFNVDSDLVSPGKLWILTQIIAYCVNKEVDSILLSINDGVATYLLERNNMYSMGDTLKVRNQVTLKGGDSIRATFNAVPDTGQCILLMNGYELDVV